MSQELQGSLVVLWLSETGSNFKAVVCETESQMSTTAEVNTTRTKCGTFKAPGQVDDKLSGSGVVDAAPAANQVSFKQLRSWAKSRTLLYFIYQNLADPSIGVSNGDGVYSDGRGYITETTVTSPEGDLVKFNWAMEVTGETDDTADS